MQRAKEDMINFLNKEQDLDEELDKKREHE